MSLLLLFLSSGGPVGVEIRVEMDFGSGYEEVTDDVVAVETFSIEYGITGNTPLDRLAGPGTFEFALRNDTSNSGGLNGYYSPNHVNCRTGFTFGIPVRVIFTYEAEDRTKFTGKLYVIDPLPGRYGVKRTHCTAHDYMYEAAEVEIREIDPQIDQTETQLLAAVLAASPVDAQPVATDFDADVDVYPFAFDDIQKGVKVITAFDKIMTSCWGKLVVKGDGTLRYLNRQSGFLQSSALTFDDDMHGLVAPTSRVKTYDHIRVTGHPKTLTATDTVVLCALPTTDTPPLFIAGETKTLWMAYKNATNDALHAGGKDFQDPVTAPTDYTANTVADGSGIDKTADFTVTASFFASTVKFEITNGGAGSAYLTKLQGRGRGIYDVTPVTQTSISGTGTRLLPVDLPYQDDVNVLQDLGDRILHEYESLVNQVDEVTFSPHESAEFIRQALDREPGDLLLLTETMIGLTDAPAVIHRVQLRVVNGTWLECTWGLAPRVAGDQWLLDDPDLSLLEDTTVLSYA